MSRVSKKVKAEKIDRYYERLFAKCRREWSYNNPVKKECALLAREQVGSVYKWWCNHCNDKFAWSEIAFDHIVPIGNTIPRTLEEFIECVSKLNCPLSNLQVLCKKCHVVKTNLDESSKVRPQLEEYCNKSLSEWGFPFNLSRLDFKKVKRLNTIIGKINTFEEPKKKQVWRVKLLGFIKDYG